MQSHGCVWSEEPTAGLHKDHTGDHRGEQPCPDAGEEHLMASGFIHHLKINLVKQKWSTCA